MKSVLISIQPKWCELIARGEKTIEVRKTRPKLETPFKCFIYCTGGKGKRFIEGEFTFYRWNGIRLIKRHVAKGWLKDNPEQTWQVLLDYHHTHPILRGDYELNGKVIGEFVCDKIEEICQDYSDWLPKPIYDLTQKELNKICLSENELWQYGEGKTLYGWHISNLIIYDKPKELYEFSRFGAHITGGCCINGNCKYYISNGYYEPPQCEIEGCTINYPLQSWCYVEV